MKKPGKRPCKRRSRLRMLTEQDLHHMANRHEKQTRGVRMRARRAARA